MDELKEEIISYLERYSICYSRKLKIFKIRNYLNRKDEDDLKTISEKIKKSNEYISELVEHSYEWYNNFYNKSNECCCGADAVYGEDCNVNYHAHWCNKRRYRS
jgi:hypothetical protein